MVVQALPLILVSLVHRSVLALLAVCFHTQHKPAFKLPQSTSVSIAALSTTSITLTCGTDVAIVTGIYLATYNIGSALGNTISGALWQQVIPNELARQTGNTSLAATVYADPFTFATEYRVGTPERDAVIQAYRHVQRLLCIAGICLSLLLIAFSVVIRNPKLGKEQSLENAEELDCPNKPVSDGQKTKNLWDWLKS